MVDDREDRRAAGAGSFIYDGGGTGANLAAAPMPQLAAY